MTQALVMVAAMSITHASAAINKCISPDGKVVFSDQPCLTGQTGTALKEAVQSPAIKPQDASEAARQAARQRLRAGVTPDCADMHDKLDRYTLSKGASMSGAELESMLDRYEQRCAPQMREAIKAENDRNVAQSKRLTAINECAAKRRVLDERRPKFASLSADEKRMFALIETEVARDCK